MREHKGFTMIELMMVVAIIGILAAVAVPQFEKYIKKSKSSEAPTNLRKIFDGELAYFYEEHTTGGGVIVSRQFVVTHTSSSWPPGIDKRMGNFTSPDWNAIKFSADSPSYYLYFADAYPFPTPYPYRPPQFDVTSDPPSGIDIGMQVMAIGDLDGDGQYASFRRSAGIKTGESELELEAGIFILDDLE